MVTFYGDQRLILCDDGLTDLNVRDLYAYWKQWVIQDNNSKYPHALAVVGGEPTTGDNIITPYFFLHNSWKIRPHEANHTLKVSGILLTSDDTDVFIDTIDNWRIGINAIVPVYTETVKVGSGLSAEEAAILRDIGNTVDTIDTKVDTIDTEVGVIDVKVDTLDTEVGDISGKVDTIDTEVGELTDDVTATRVDILEVHIAIDDLPTPDQMSELELHAGLDSYVNKDDFKADISGIQTGIDTLIIDLAKEHTTTRNTVLAN